MIRSVRFGFVLDAVALIALALAALAGIGSAQAAVTPFARPLQSGGTNQTATQTLHGTVEQTAPALVLRVNRVNTTLQIAPGATVTRNGKAVPLSSLKHGDTVDAVLGADGAAESLAAHSASASPWPWLLPLLIALALLLALLAVIVAARRDAFVLEPGRDPARPRGRRGHPAGPLGFIGHQGR
ncbi:MAG TPA: hypothetical protein VFD32_22245 [Dehalococcoidia bacterium]|nr:hypothetical protein [Dehalococcoidia bacterium]